MRQGLFAQGTLGTARASLLAVPLASVRTDKPAPYVQVIENAQVVYKTVTLGARGSADGVDVVAVTGLSDGTLVLGGNVGSLRESTRIKFTPMNAPATAPATAPAIAAASAAASAAKPAP